MREIYFSQDEHTAVLIFECADAAEGRQVLDTLPLVQAGLITFHVILLTPYSGLSSQFSSARS